MRGGEKGSMEERKNKVESAITLVKLICLYEAGAALLFLPPLNVGQVGKAE